MTFVDLVTIRRDPPRDRVRQHGARIFVELREKPLQPARMPPVVIAYPCEVFRRRALAGRDLDNLPPCGDHGLPRGVPDIADTRIPPDVLARDLLRFIRRCIVQEHEREIGPGLRQQRFEGVRQVARVVIERHPEHDARARGRAARNRRTRACSSARRPPCGGIEPADHVAISRLRGVDRPRRLGRLLHGERVVAVEHRHLGQAVPVRQCLADAHQLRVVERTLTIEAVQQRATGRGRHGGIATHLRIRHLLKRDHVDHEVQRQSGDETRQRVGDEHEIGVTPPFEGRGVIRPREEDLRVGKHEAKVAGGKQEQLREVDDHVGRARKEGLELIGKSSPARADLADERAIDAADRAQDPAALHSDQHLVELQRVDIEDAAANVVPKAAERGRLRNQQLVATQRAKFLQPALEELPAAVVLVAIVVRPDVGDVKRVMPQLPDDERRGVDHVVDVLELLRPVRARAGRAGRAFHPQHGVARARVRLELGRRSEFVGHASSAGPGGADAGSPAVYGGRSRVSRRGSSNGSSRPISIRRRSVLKATE